LIISKQARVRWPHGIPHHRSIEAYASEIASIRADGLMWGLPIDEIERIFVLEFALQQLQQDFSDLARCVQDWTRSPS
jgi:hypothetical protein